MSQNEMVPESQQGVNLPNARDQANDLLAKARPAQFVANFIQKLEEEGEAVLTRLFEIATDEGTAPGTALKAIDQILKISKADEVMQVALGLKRQVGRPGSEAEQEAARQAEEWADIVDLEEQSDGSFARSEDDE